MFKYKIPFSKMAEPEERCMSDLSDWGSTVTSSAGESSVFFYTMKKDYYHYSAEFKSGKEKKEAADESLKAYQAATNAAESDLSHTHPIQLDLALNFSVFCYEIMNSPERGCYLAK
ncbi:hypothetical protein ACSBR2_021856 [Camellia fascicularis]